MSCFLDIDGWFGEMEAQFYLHQVRYAEDEASFVEIGSWKGRSSYCMAEAIRASGKRIGFWCVDTWRGSEEHEQTTEVREDTLYEEFLHNTRAFRDTIKPMRMSSREAARHFDDASLDFVFIDAAHDYDNVLADIRAWRGKVKPGGVLAGHDYHQTWPGVVQAVESEFGTSAGSHGLCWYWSEQNGNCYPWSLRAWKKHIHWKLRRWTQPNLFRRSAA